MSTQSTTLKSARRPIFIALVIALLLAACTPAPQPSVTSVSVQLPLTALYTYGTYQASATVVVVGGASTAVEWSSSDPTVASVDSSGLVTALDSGTASIVATSTFDDTKVGAVVVTVSHPLAGATVVYYTDSNAPNLAALDALEKAEVQHGLQLTTSITGTFDPALLDDAPDLLFHYRRGNNLEESEAEALAAYAEQGGRIVFGHWDRSDAGASQLATQFGAPYTTENNYSQVTVTDPELLRGLNDATLLLSNLEGWGIFNTGHTAAEGAGVWASYDDDSPALVSGNGGQTVVVGFFEDSVDNVDGAQFFSNLFTKVVRMALEAR